MKDPIYLKNEGEEKGILIDTQESFNNLILSLLTTPRIRSMAMGGVLVDFTKTVVVTRQSSNPHEVERYLMPPESGKK